MPTVETRDYRACAEFRAADNEEYTVEGYATTFNAPYILYSFDGVDYFEEVDARAFDEADTRDVIMQYDHAGRVLARTKNGTLSLTVDDHGLKVRADLSKSDAARAMYEDIKTGLVYQMSFGFTVAEDSYNNETHTRRILKIKRLYDVSAVSIPANDGTSISVSTRALIDGEIEKATAECRQREEIERKRKALALLLEL